MSALAVASLHKCFGPLVALDGVSLDLADGEFFCVLGPTNAGKSTLLKTVAGLHRPDAGRIELGGRDIGRLPPRDRNVSLLFQNIALFPTMTGFDNIAFPLRAAGVEGPAVRRRVEDVADLLRIDYILDRLPGTCSGGERQRIAVGRAIARRCDLLMLDEPLSNLDARIRIALRIEFKKLHRELRQTILYVTHDQVEAMSLSDRVAVLNAGRVEQTGTPDEIYHRPASRFVAEFIGTPPMNILDAELGQEGDVPTLRGSGFHLALPALRSAIHVPPRRLAFGVRAEDVRVAAAPDADAPLAAEVMWIEHLGAKNILDLRLGDAIVKAVVPPDHPASREGPAWLGLAPEPHHLLDRDTGIFLR